MRFSRTENLIGADGLEKLKNAKVIVFGVGGVGGYTVEALARAGVGSIAVVDNDTVSESNINRQIIALQSTIGQMKTEVVKKRIAEINPACKVQTFDIFFLPETELDLSEYDYVADAVDTVTAKIEIIRRAKEAGVPVISCMGTGNKLSATALTVEDISKTSVCPLARVMRRELKKRGIERVKTVYSKEEPREGGMGDGKPVPASISYVPPVAGLLMAGEMIKDLLQ